MNFDNTLGAILISGSLTALLFGMIILQTFSYFRTFLNDPPGLKLFVFFIFIVDTAHMGCVQHAIYWLLVSNFDNPLVLNSLPASVFVGSTIAALSDMGVRLFFVRRIWILSQKMKLLTLPLYVLVFCTALASFACSIKTFSLLNIEKIAEISWLLRTTLALVLAGDFSIAITTCVLLYRSRTGHGNTNSIINILLAYTINSGFLTSALAAVEVFTSLSAHTRVISLAMTFPLSKCYTNAMLASLNAREALRHYSSRATGPQDLSTTSSVVFYRQSEEPPTHSLNHASSDHQTFSLRSLRDPAVNKGSEDVLDVSSKLPTHEMP